MFLGISARCKIVAFSQLHAGDFSAAAAAGVQQYIESPKITLAGHRALPWDVTVSKEAHIMSVV